MKPLMKTRGSNRPFSGRAVWGGLWAMMLGAAACADGAAEPAEKPAGSAGLSEAAQPLHNGIIDFAGEHGFVVALHVPMGNFFCAGILVSPRWVLTAAHCVNNVDNITTTDDVEVRFGVDTLQPDMSVLHTFAESGRMILHPDWSVGRTTDLALIRLDRAVPAGRFRPIRPILSENVSCGSSFSATAVSFQDPGAPLMGQNITGGFTCPPGEPDESPPSQHALLAFCDALGRCFPVRGGPSGGRLL